MKPKSIYRFLAAATLMGGMSLISASCLTVKATDNSRTVQASAQDTSSVIMASRYMPTDGSADVSDAIQRLIDSHPNRTIYFPDGVYKVSRPILTPADPKRSVMLELANYARLQATGDWAAGGAVVRLGATHPANNIRECGSNYGLRGGIIDGGGVADGVSIDGGRETVVQNVSIKNVRVGVHVKHGANNGSSDADVSGVNVVGINTTESVGLLVEGFDNTFTNMRIAGVNVGVMLKSSGNMLRNIHPLYTRGDRQDYGSTRGFVIERSSNWLDFCYSDTFAKAFWLGRDVSATLTNCYTFWYTGYDKPEVGIWCEGKFCSVVNGLRCDFCTWKEVPAYTLLHAEPGGNGSMVQTVVPAVKLSADDASAAHMR